MEDQLDKTIRELTHEINQLKTESVIIEETDRQVPSNIQQYIQSNNYKEQLSSLDVLLECCDKIDSIKAIKGKPYDLLKTCKEVLVLSKHRSCSISFETKVKMFNDIIMSNKGKVEAALLVIKFPIFDGFLLRPIIDKMKSEHENEMNLLTNYFSIMSYLPIHQTNIKFTIMDEISILLHKKIVASIVIPYKKSQCLPNQSPTLRIGEIFDSIKSYLMKCFHNLSELLSLVNCDYNPDVTTGVMMTFFIEQTFHLLNSTFNQSSLLLEQIDGNIVELIQQISIFNNELFKVYSYDVLLNESFNNLINQIAKKKLDTIITHQKGFCDTIILSTIASKINKAIADNQYNTEDIVDLIKLIVKDNMNLFAIFQEEKVIEDIIIFSFKKLYVIFDGYFLNDYLNELGEAKYLFLFNLLYSVLNLFNKFYASFKKRICAMNFNFKDNVNQHYINYSKSLIELIDWYTNSFKKLFSFDEIVSLIKVEAISSLTKKQIKSVFQNAENRIKTLFDSIDKVKLMTKVEEILITIIFKEFANKLIEKLEALYLKGSKGHEFDLLSLKLKGFINIFIDRDGLTDNTLKGVENYIKDINKLLSNLNMLKTTKKE